MMYDHKLKVIYSKDLKFYVSDIWWTNLIFGLFGFSNPKVILLYKKRHPNVTASHLAISPHGNNSRYVTTPLTSLVLITPCTKESFTNRQTTLLLGLQEYAFNVLLGCNQQNVNAVISTNFKYHLLLIIDLSRLKGNP